MTSRTFKVDYYATRWLAATALMPARIELAYRRLCDLIYETRDRVYDTPATWRQAKAGKGWRAVRAYLIDHEKIAVEPDGRITNERCSEELAKAARRQKGSQTASERDAKGRPKGTPNGIPKGRSVLSDCNDLPAPSRARELAASSYQLSTESSAAAAGGTDAAAAAGSAVDRIVGLVGAKLAKSDLWGTWAAAGADLERDVLPAIASVLERERARPGNEGWLPKSLRYFDDAVRARARLRRIQETAPVEAEPVRAAEAPAADLSDNPLCTLLLPVLGEAACRSWIKPLAARLAGDEVVVEAPTRFMRDWVSTHYADAIMRALDGKTVSVVVGKPQSEMRLLRKVS